MSLTGGADEAQCAAEVFVDVQGVFAQAATDCIEAGVDLGTG